MCVAPKVLFARPPLALYVLAASKLVVFLLQLSPAASYCFYARYLAAFYAAKKAHYRNPVKVYVKALAVIL